MIEDGTGIPGALQYIDSTEANQILEDFAYDVEVHDSDLVNASLYLDTYFFPTSKILTKDQGLLWPRVPFRDSQGREVEGIPVELKRAVAFIAAESKEKDLFESTPAITLERFGDSQVRYAGPTKDDGKLKSILLRLKNLGYGTSNSSSVTLERA